MLRRGLRCTGDKKSEPSLFALTYLGQCGSKLPQTAFWESGSFDSGTRKRRMVRTVLGGSCPPFAMVYWRMFMSYWWAHPNRAYLYITSDQLVCDLLSFGRFTETHLLAPPTQLPRSWRFRPKSWSLRSTTCQLVDRFVSHEFRPELPFDHGSQAS